MAIVVRLIVQYDYKEYKCSCHDLRHISMSAEIFATEGSLDKSLQCLQCCLSQYC